jgi:hypothetical protein
MEEKAMSSVEVLAQAYNEWEGSADGSPSSWHQVGSHFLDSLRDNGYRVVEIDPAVKFQDQYAINKLVQKAIDHRKMGIPLSAQIAEELQAAGFTLTPSRIPDPIFTQDVGELKASRIGSGFKVQSFKVHKRHMLAALFGEEHPHGYPHGQARRIIEIILPRVVRRYLEKSKDYGENAQTLGLKGQFADINRKFVKLKRAWWDDKELHSESAEEVAEDMIAHLLLSLLFLDEKKSEVDDDEDS